jgi:hypothetical protein
MKRHETAVFRHTLTFTLGGSSWTLRCSVEDPAHKNDALAKSVRSDPDYTLEMRILKGHFEDSNNFPAEGASCVFDGGTLKVMRLLQPHEFVGQETPDGWQGMRHATCRHSR